MHANSNRERETHDTVLGIRDCRVEERAAGCERTGVNCSGDDARERANSGPPGACIRPRRSP